MSGQPPQLSAETGTPASEWAHSTTTAAFARDDPAPALDSSLPPGIVGTQSSVSTPGGEFPGAYPTSPSSEFGTGTSTGTGSLNAQGLTDTAKNAVQTVTTTAAQYVPVAKNLVGSVSSYLPGTGSTTNGDVRASEHDDPHATSLPTSETQGALEREHVGGTGALPGSVAEERVTKLPDEDVSTTATSLTTQAGTYPSSPYPQVQPTTAVTARTSLPSYDVTGQAPGTHQDGVGALPGTFRETGVAVLPDEGGKPAGATNATNPATGTLARDYNGGAGLSRPSEEEGNESVGLGERRVGKDVSGGVGALVGGKTEEGVAVLPDERGDANVGSGVTEGGKGDKLGEMDQAEREERHEKAGTGNVTSKETQQGGGYDTNYHPAALHPQTQTTGEAAPSAEPQGAATKGDATKEDNKEGGQGISTTGDKVTGGEKVKKAGFLDKMRGEAKVLMGKMEGKKGVEKVQEGRKMKAGEA